MIERIYVIKRCHWVDNVDGYDSEQSDLCDGYGFFTVLADAEAQVALMDAPTRKRYDVWVTEDEVRYKQELAIYEASARAREANPDISHLLRYVAHPQKPNPMSFWNWARMTCSSWHEIDSLARAAENQ